MILRRYFENMELLLVLIPRMGNGYKKSKNRNNDESGPYSLLNLTWHAAILT